jgi:hypothetical protein
VCEAERWEVRLLLGRQGVFETLASDEHLAIQLDARRAGRIGDEQLLADRHDRSRAGAETIRIDGHIAPPDHRQTFVDEDGPDCLLGLFGVGRVERQECHPTAYAAPATAARIRRPRESIGDLDEDSRAVAGVGLGAGCTPMLEIAERTEAHGHDRPACCALHVRDERDAASVVFEPWIVETLRRGKARLRVSAHLFGSTEAVNG